MFLSMLSRLDRLFAVDFDDVEVDGEFAVGFDEYELCDEALGAGDARLEGGDGVVP